MQAEPSYATQRTQDRYSDGPEVGRQIARWQGRRPTRWQQEELDVALERVDGPGSRFAYDEVIFIVGRRCGKTVLSFGVPLVRALAGPVTLPNGRRLPFRGVHVAQNISAAQQRFAEDLVRPYEQRFTEDAWQRSVRDLSANGNTRLILDPRKSKSIKGAERLGIASELRVLAPTGNSARGAGVFHRTYDEELTYLYEKGQELAEAGRPTMAELFGHGQTWHASNIRRDTDARYYLWHQREKGREAVRKDRRDGICYREFSLPPGDDPDDESNWWRHYPALGDGIVSIEQLRRDREEFTNADGTAAGFNAEYLGRWADETPTGLVGWHVIDTDDFLAAGVSEEIPAEADAAIGVDMDPFGRSWSIFAVVDGDRGELIAHVPGSEGAAEAVLDLVPSVAAIGIDDYGQGHALIDQLQGTAAESKLVISRGQDVLAACYTLDAGLKAHTLTWRHNDFDEAMLKAAAAAEHTTGRAWQYDRKVTESQTPILSWALALWALRHRPALTPFPQIF